MRWRLEDKVLEAYDASPYSVSSLAWSILPSSACNYKTGCAWLADTFFKLGTL